MQPYNDQRRACNRPRARASCAPEQWSAVQQLDRAPSFKPPPTVRAPLVGARIRAANRATTHASTVCAQNHAQTSALQLWPIKLGATSLALTLWRSNFGTSNFGAPTLALQLWRSNLGAPTLALRLWRSSLGAQIWRPNVGDPTVALKPWHHKSSPYRINHESYNMNQDPSTTNN